MEQTAWLVLQREEIATKEYEDHTRPWIEETPPQVFQAEEAAQTAINAAKARQWRILPGMKFMNQVVAIDGKKQVFRGASDLVEICIKYNIFNS